MRIGKNLQMQLIWQVITVRILEEEMSYDVAIEAVKKIASSGMFE